MLKLPIQKIKGFIVPYMGGPPFPNDVYNEIKYAIATFPY
jgi:hypothetical protein